MRKLRKSANVTLVLIGVSALYGCGADDTRRDVYRTREDCLADWSNKPEDCQPATDPAHRRSGYFYGPSYGYHSGGSGTSWFSGTRGNRSIGSTSSGHVSRGGFGSSGHSSGG